jgi:aminoglycoside phosphotransferase (APT) family kinase protein
MPFLDGSVERPPPHAGPCCLTHGDLQADHILLNAEGDICGIIDFGDASVSEPACDYAGLCAWQGWDSARTALGSSGLAVDNTIERRIIFMARCLGLIGLGWADWQDGARVSACPRFLQNAFGG